MISQKADTRNSERRMGDLGRCYGRIGIPAVVAALPYKCGERNTDSDKNNHAGDKRSTLTARDRQS
jgi:hypothetical protein